MKDPIVQTGAPVLQKKAVPVHKKDLGSQKLARLISHMKAALAPQENGVALAAPQVGEPLRIFIISPKVFWKSKLGEKKTTAKNVSKKSSDPAQGSGQTFSQHSLPPNLVFINPELVRLSRTKKMMSEGCLSVRGDYGMVMRHEKASVRALDERGKPFTLHGSGLLAQIFQHEVDHLEGVLFTDKAEHIKHEEEK